MKSIQYSIAVFALSLMCFLFIDYAYPARVGSRESGKLRNIGAIPKENVMEQFRYASQLQADGNYQKARREYKKVIKYFPDSTLVPKAQFRVAQCNEELGLYTKAFKAYQVVLDKYPSYPDPEKILEHQFEIATRYYLRKTKNLPLIPIPISSGKGKARRLYEKIAETAPFSKYAAQAKYRAALLLEKKKKYDDEEGEKGAISTYQSILDNYSDSGLADDALFRLGMCYYRKAKKTRYNKKAIERAMIYFKRYATDFPDGEFIEEVKEKIGELDFKSAKGAYEIASYYEKRRKTEAALVYYTEVYEKYPLSEWAEKAKIKLKELEGKKQ